MSSPRRALLFLLAGIFATCAAQAASDQSSSPATLDASSVHALLSNSGDDSQLAASTPDQEAIHRKLIGDLQKVQRSMLSKTQCYAMRSYKFKREEKQGDALKPSGETTCEASSLYSVKNATGFR